MLALSRWSALKGNLLSVGSSAGSIGGHLLGSSGSRGRSRSSRRTGSGLKRAYVLVDSRA